MAHKFRTVVDRFLASVDLSKPEVVKALGLTPRFAEVFQIALNAADDAGEVASLMKTLKTNGIKNPSPIIDGLKKRKFLATGSQRGNWAITDKAIKTMQAAIDDDLEIEAPQEPDKKKSGRKPRKDKGKKRPKKRGRKPGPKPGKKGKRGRRKGKPGPKPRTGKTVNIEDMTIGQFEQRMNELTKQIEELTSERDGMSRAFRDRVKKMTK